MVPRTIASWTRNASAMSAGESSHRRVESSISVNKKVTVPVGCWRGMPER
jgi:hypothetical protein